MSFVFRAVRISPPDSPRLWRSNRRCEQAEPFLLCKDKKAQIPAARGRHNGLLSLPISLGFVPICYPSDSTSRSSIKQKPLTGASVPSAALPSLPSQFAGTPLSTIVSGRFPGSSLSKAASFSASLSLSVDDGSASALDLGPKREEVQFSPSQSVEDTETSCAHGRRNSCRLPCSC